MLKKRIAATLIVKNGIVVQSIGFKLYRPIGKPEIAMEYLNSWGIDEIILLDISASTNNSEPNYELIKSASKKCFVPLTVGGGISSLKQISHLMQCGSDKIALNQSAINNPDLITKASELFGNQCIIVSIDAIFTPNGYRVFDYKSNKILSISPSEMAINFENLGAGEILINSVDRDGSYLGYDNNLINIICKSVSIPVIASGGAKNAKDIIDVLKNTNACAASASNFYHFTEHSVNTTKANIKKIINIRLETMASYKDSQFDYDFRLQKKTDTILEELLFIKIEKEII